MLFLHPTLWEAILMRSNQRKESDTVPVKSYTHLANKCYHTVPLAEYTALVLIVVELLIIQDGKAYSHALWSLKVMIISKSSCRTTYLVKMVRHWAVLIISLHYIFCTYRITLFYFLCYVTIPGYLLENVIFQTDLVYTPRISQELVADLE